MTLNNNIISIIIIGLALIIYRVQMWRSKKLHTKLLNKLKKEGNNTEEIIQYIQKSFENETLARFEYYLLIVIALGLLFII